MKSDHTLSGLFRKRDELVQQREQHRMEAARLSNDVKALERTLQAFGVVGSPQPPMKYQHTFERNELRRFILACFRQHETATTRVVTDAVFKAKGLYLEDRRLRSDVQSTVTRAMIHMADRGMVERSVIPRAYVWQVKNKRLVFNALACG